jgi:acyl-CoA synthetase (AMP-forming)/AMP-acid ligase II
MFWSRLDNFAASVALTDQGSGDISYRQLADMAEGWGERIDAIAAGSADDRARLLIGVEMASRADLIAAYLGALRGGHAVIIGAPGDFARDAPLARTYLPNAVMRIDGDRCTLAEAGTAPANLHPDLCLMLSTSGSTGDPRLVRLSHRNIASNATSIAEYLALQSDDRALTTLPLHYSYGLSVLHSHLAVGACIVLGDLSVTDHGFATAAARDGVTGLALVPHQVELMEAQGFDFAALPALRRVTQAGGRLAPDAVRRMAARGRAEGWDFIVMYGQTEAGPRMAWLPPHLADTAPDTIGQAIPGGRFWIEGPDGMRLTRSGQSGALVYQGPNVMMGYAGARADLALPAGPDILQTGDIAEATPEGLFRIVGREKRFVKLFALRLSLDQIEARLAVGGLPAHAASIDDRLVIVVRPGIAARRVQDTLAAAFDLPGTAITVAGSPTSPASA